MLTSTWTRTARAGAVVLLLLPAAACRRSPVGAHETVTISGTVLATSGAPDAGRKMKLYDHDVIDAIFMLALPLIIPLETTRANGAGAYSMNVSGALANGFLGARSFSLETDAGIAEPSVSVSLKLMQTQVAVPTARLWDGNGRATAGAADVVFAWDDIGAHTGLAPGFHNLEVKAAGLGSWMTWTGSSATWSMRRLALQDYAIAWRPWGYVDERGSGTKFRFAYRGAERRLGPLNPPPPSRGQVAILTPPGTATGALTDGALGSALPQAMTTGGRIELDLGQTRSLQALFLFNLRVTGQDLFVSIGTTAGGGRTRIAALRPPNAFLTEVPVLGLSARYVTLETTGSLESLGEIVVY